MNPRQKRFADEYLIDLKTGHAAIRAGYSAKTADQIGYQILQIPSVIEYLKERSQTLAQKLGIDATYVLGTTKSICESTKRSDPKASLKGLDMLGKHLKLWADDDKKLQQNITINILDF